MKLENNKIIVLKQNIFDNYIELCYHVVNHISGLH